MTKGITSLDSLLEARRLIRSMRISSDKNIKEFKKITPSNGNYLYKSLNQKHKATIINIIKQCKRNIKLSRHIMTILSTHLFEQSNLNKKLQRQNKMILDENEELQKQSEEVLENTLSIGTKFDSPLKIIISDLVKKFSKNLNVNSKILEDNETYGILTLKSMASTDIVYVVIFCKDEGNSFKTFLNDLPTDFTDKNYTNFASPSQAYKLINDILVQDGILR